MKRKMITILMSIALCFTVPQGILASVEEPAEIPIEAEDPVNPEDDSLVAADDPKEADKQAAFEVPETGIVDPDAPQISESLADEGLVGASKPYTFTVTYGQTEARSMLSMVNSFRTGADAWYWNEDNTTKTYCQGLSELTYDYQLEKIAMIRAAEIAVSFSHTRPNSKSCFTAYDEQNYSWWDVGENAAAGQRTAQSAYVSWREDNDNYDGQGHRRNMLDTDFNRIGIGHVVYGGYHYWVQEFAKSTSSITTTTANDSSVPVEVQIDDSKIISSSISTSVSSIELAEKETYPLPTAKMSLSVSEHWGSALYADVSCTWSVSDTSVAKISGSNLVGVSQGNTTLKSTVNGQNLTISVAVNHVPVKDPAVAATCTKTGLTEGSHCSVCGKVITAQTTVPMKAHTSVTDPAVPATCAKTGLTEGSHCSVCNTVIKAQTTVPMKAHTPVTDPAVPATCTMTGLTEGSHCSVCGKVITAQKTVPMKAHTPVTDPAVPATCTKTGLTEGSHCSVCGKLIKAQTEVKALGHEWSDWTVIKEATYDSTGEKQRVCRRDASHSETAVIPKLVKSGFSDVQDQSHPYYKAIYWAAEAEITKGYPDGTFGIDKSCTRGEMMMFLWRYADKPAPKNVSTLPFKDVPKSHAFYKAILWGSQKGITKGYPDGNFGIDRNVSRGEAMMFLWRLKGKPAPKVAVTSPFKDVPTNHVFYKAILWGSQKKVTTGYTSGPNKGKFMVNDNCTRGQIVTFLYRAK